VLSVGSSAGSVDRTNVHQRLRSGENEREKGERRKEKERGSGRAACVCFDRSNPIEFVLAVLSPGVFLSQRNQRRTVTKMAFSESRKGSRGERITGADLSATLTRQR